MVNRKDYSLRGAIIIVISQLFSSYQSSDSISKEIEKFRKEFQQSLLDRETYFVRKTELAAISSKIDQLGLKIAKMSEQIKSLKVDIYSQNNDGIIGCSFHTRKSSF